MRAVPHSVQDGAVLHDSEESIGRSHVVSHGSFAIPEERVRGPDFGHHQVIQTEDLHRALIPQPPIHPRLAEEHIHGVLLEESTNTELSKPDANQSDLLLTESFIREIL